MSIFSHELYKSIIPFNSLPEDYSLILKYIGNAHSVFIGEASHGTYEFYNIRANLTRYLIEEKGFQAVAIERDWSDVYNINKYVKNQDKSINEYKSLESFKRFPSWMWGNEEMLKFIKWLRIYNDELRNKHIKVGIYGFDLYNLHASMDIVVKSLEKVNPQAASRARKRYECLEYYIGNPAEYAYLFENNLIHGCKEEVYDQLIDLLDMEPQIIDPEEFLFIMQNAKVVVNAEAYYRSLLKGPEVTWNLRDTHMMDTIEAIRTFYRQISGGLLKTVIWAHNSHIGDARATELAERGEINLGQLARERYNNDCYLIGFSTYTGEVTAASKWGGVTEKKKVKPALKESYEDIFHNLNTSNFFLSLNNNIPLKQPYFQRAIGVIYRPETERISHYYYAYLPHQFNCTYSY